MLKWRRRLSARETENFTLRLDIAQLESQVEALYEYFGLEVDYQPSKWVAVTKRLREKKDNE